MYLNISTAFCQAKGHRSYERANIVMYKATSQLDKKPLTMIIQRHLVDKQPDWVIVAILKDSNRNLVRSLTEAGIFCTNA